MTSIFDEVLHRFWLPFGVAFAYIYMFSGGRYLDDFGDGVFIDFCRFWMENAAQNDPADRLASVLFATFPQPSAKVALLMHSGRPLAYF